MNGSYDKLGISCLEEMETLELSDVRDGGEYKAGVAFVVGANGPPNVGAPPNADMKLGGAGGSDGCGAEVREEEVLDWTEGIESDEDDRERVVGSDSITGEG